MSRQILAIDIRNDAIVALLINFGLKSNSMAASVQVPIGATSQEQDPLAHAFAALLEQMDPTAASVVVSLPVEKTLFRFLTVPFKEDNKIRQILPFELESTLPVGVENLKIDFQKSVVDDKTYLLAVAIAQSELQDFMEKLASTNIRPQLVAPKGFALLSFITAREHDSELSKAIFLDVDRTKTTLFAMRQGRIELVRSLAAGVDDDSEAESLALRVRQTLAAWNDAIQDDAPPTVVYAGGPGLYHPDNLARLSRALEMPVQTIDLLQWIPRMERPETVTWQPAIMNEALALAMMEAEGAPCPNFHRISSPLRNFWSAYKPYILKPAILLALVFMIAASGILLENHQLQKQVDILDEQLKQVFLATFPGARLTAPPLDQMRSKLKEAAGDSDSELKVVQVRSIDVLQQLSELVPDSIDVLLSRVTIGAEEVTVAGETTDFNSVDEIKNRLGQSALFKQITISSANMDKSGKKVLFKLKIDL